jgi:glucosamine--fructose-6-phosphate aminotransferase (isomerizing)
MEGLKRLEYRGYDSAGIAVMEDGKLRIQKKAGKVSDLERILEPSDAMVGIGHTRWATHGEPNDRNAHPHIDSSGSIALVHNGIIENHASIRQTLERTGCSFTTSTDTEAMVQLIGRFHDQTTDFETAVRRALKEITGTYGIAVLCEQEPDKIIIARKGSPLVIGIGDKEYFIGSDMSAFLPYTRQIIVLGEGEIAIITREGVTTKTIENVEITKDVEEITLDIKAIEKGGYPHFMLKEIHSQPETLTDTMRGRVLKGEGLIKLGGLTDVIPDLQKAERFIITACGTSWHAALIGKCMLEQYARIPVEVDYASEFRYRDPIIQPNTIVWVISQSGETTDTLSALREAKRKGTKGLGICNVVGSFIARETDAGVYIHAGPEIGVASTKAFTSQLIVLAMITLFMARLRGVANNGTDKIFDELMSVPEKVKHIFDQEDHIKKIAREYSESRNFLYLGRGYNFPVALEGALKLKEVSYIHAEGYPAAEMKHGPIALIDEHMPVVFIAPHDRTYEKILGNIQEVKARRGSIIAVTDESDSRLEALVEHIIRVPKIGEFLSPVLTIIPLQLLAYYIAIERGCDVDQPRNLAKSVTVE